MSTSHAKPNLTTPVDMSVLHAKDSGYHFTSHTFSAPAADTTGSKENSELSKAWQAYAKPRHYQVWLGIPKQYAHTRLSQTHKEARKVLYLLDGNAAIDEVNKELLRTISHSSQQEQAPILVFIGYQTPYRFDVDARAYDYTPPLISTKARVPYAFKEDGMSVLFGDT